MSAGRHALRIAALLAGYAALTAWLTWPLVVALGLRLPCTQAVACPFDTVYSAWAASWVSHALITTPFRLGAANIYHPAPDALYYGPAAFGAVPYALPAFVATGNAAAAINTAFLSSVVLTALALHWVVWRWTGSTLAGFVAAWALLMNRWFLWGFVAATPHLAPIQYLPLIAFLAARPLEGWRPAVVLLLLLTLQCLTDPVYVAAAALAPLGVLAAARILRSAWRPSGWRLLGVMTGALVCLMPFLAGYARVRAANPGLAQQSLWNQSPLVAASAGVVPSDLTTLFWVGGYATTMAPAITGLIALGALMAVVRWWRGTGSGLEHAWRHAALWAAVGTWMSLSPIASIGNAWRGGWRVYLPQYVLVPLGFYQVVRVPDRLGVAGMIGLCLLGGVAFAECVRTLDAWHVRSHWKRLLSVAAAVTVAALAYRIPPGRSPALPSRYPLQAAPTSSEELLRALGAGDGPVLELPALDWRTKRAQPRRHALAMYRSTRHWRPLLNGYSSYWPVGFYERMHLAELLPAASALRALVCQTGVRTIVVDLGKPFPARTAWLRASRAPLAGLRLAATPPGFLVFDVTMPRPGEPGAPDCEGLGTPSPGVP